MPGPLEGMRVVEVAGMGPGPFAAMLLADLGAEVIRVDRIADTTRPHKRPDRDVLLRGRRSIALDLKSPSGVETLLRLVDHADALLEGFRPGVMERLGVGPDVCLARNPGLIYGRVTGWGQDGPLAMVPGHDLNYIALAGALAHFGTESSGPVLPLNLVGDFAGGGMFLALGIVSAWLERQRSGLGQVVDTAMIDGTAVTMAMLWGYRTMGRFDEDSRGSNMIDSGAHFYNVYECSDGEHITIGSIETPFYETLLEVTGLASDPDLPAQMDAGSWPMMKDRLARVFATKTRTEWTELLEGTDVCFAPVLRMREAAEHPHNVARNTFVEVGDVIQPAPAPRFSRTSAELRLPPPTPGQHTREVLSDWGVSDVEIDELIESGSAR